MRIGFVVHEYPPRKTLGGTGRYAASAAKALRALGHEVLVFAFNGNAAEPSEFTLVHEGVPILHVSPRLSNLAETIDNKDVMEAFAAWLEANALDVIHFQHTIHLSMTLPEIAKQQGIPVVVSLHDFWLTCHRAHMNYPAADGKGLILCTPPVQPLQCASCIKSQYQLSLPPEHLLPFMSERERLAKSVFAAADLVICGANHTRRAFETTLGWPGNYVTIPYGIDPVEPSARPRLANNVPTFGFMGNITQIKGLDVLLEAFRTVAGKARLVVFGDFYDDAEYFEKLRGLAADIPSVVFYGRYELEKALSLMDVLVIPSLLENYPLVALEAFMAKVPIVASNVGGLPEAVTEGVNGLLFPRGNATELATALERLVDDPALLTSLREGIRRPLTTEEHAKALENYYSSLIKGDSVDRPVVSIIIPSNNRLESTRRCLEALIAHTPENLFEVVVVDNGSTDGTQAFLRHLEGDVTVISNPADLGFAKACNQGAAAAKGKHLVFLNQDTEPRSGWLDGLLKSLETEPKVGAVGNKILLPDGKIQHAGVVFSDRGLPQNWLYETDLADHPVANQRHEFQSVTAACLAIPRPVFEQVGGFDESVPSAYENVDFCLKLRKAGYRVIYTPDSVITYGNFEGELEVAAQKQLQDRWEGQILPDARRYQAIAEGRNPLYSIAIVTYNSAATIEACIRSVLATLGPDDEVVVVDNASADDTVPIVAALAATDARVKLVQSPENLGFSEGSNLGLRRSIGKYLVLLNPDTVVTTGWLERMRAHFESGNVGAVGPTSDYVAGHQKVGLYLPLDQISGRTPEEVAALLARRGTVGVPTKLLIGFCMMIPRAILEEVGLLDPVLFLGNDDLDLSWRLRQKGYQLIVASDVFVHHRGQVSFNTEPSSKTKKLVQESTDALARKLVAHYGSGKVPSSVELWGMNWFTPSEGILEAAETASIVVLTFNQLEVTKLCVDSLFRHTRDFELIIVDNASTDGTVPYLKALAAEHDNVKLILNVMNRGFAGGCNQGIAASSGAHVVLLNNDTVVSEGWLDGLIQAAAMEGVGIVGPRTNCIVGPQQVNEIAYDPQTLQGFEAFAREWRTGNRNSWQTTRVIGFCMVIRRDVIDQIGGLDTTFGTGNFEDDDYCLRAQVAGFKIAVTDAVFIHHFGSVTFKGQKVDYRQTMDRNWALFKRKWGLPDSMPLEGGYRAAEIISQPFESVRHTVPVFSPQAIPAGLPDRRGYNLLLADDDGERLSRSIKAYLEAFQEEDDVALHVLAGQDLGRAEATIMEVLAELHRDPARIPDISLLDAPRSPLDLPGYLKAADLVLGSPEVALGARDMGLPAFTEPNAELLRTAREHFRTSDWSVRSHPFEGPRDLWLVGENWEDAMVAYLQAVKPGMAVSLLLRVPPGTAEKSQEVVAEWLVEHGHDPETIPDVMLVDQPSSVSVFRQATAWIDTGDPLGRAIAQSLGIRILVPEAIADAVRLISPAPSR